MMHIKPITDLRNTQEISELAHKSDDVIFITKNGYGDLAVMSIEKYAEIMHVNQEEKLHAKANLITSKPVNNMGFINVCCTTLHTKVSDINYNAEEIIKNVKLYQKNKIILFPELCLTAYTCHDLFLNRTLKDLILTNIQHILEETKMINSLIVFGAPLEKESRLYNCAFICFKGKIIGIVPKSFLPNYNEFYEGRHFTEGDASLDSVNLFGYDIPFSTNLLFQNALNPLEIIGVEICEDLWVPNSPHIRHVEAGATIILNLSASNEVIAKEEYRENLIKYTSAKTISAYLYTSVCEDESTTDVLFSGVSYIYENGRCLAQSRPFENKPCIATIDLDYLINERINMTSFFKNNTTGYKIINYENDIPLEDIYRCYSKYIFIPSENNRKKTYEKIITMQALGLAKRLKHTHLEKMVLGLSGGLDSTLAFLVLIKCAEILNIDKKNIIAITLPCFGTSQRTKDNASKLTEIYHTSFLEISIKESVIQHLKDLNHPLDVYDVTYENAQARERTQVLMDYANKVGGLVIGTGDLSEIALGWSTYNGDHMSMYAVNSSLPKTLIRDMVNYFSEESSAKEVLLDILSTPVSPELLPTNKKGEISQLTENYIGPYELHDFFLYMFIRNHFSIKKIYFITYLTFSDTYSKEDIKKWLKIFIKRFFSQQFKRSCMPDGIKIGSVALSPRGDLRMPSDASVDSFIQEVDNL